MSATEDRELELRRRLAEIAERTAALAPEDFAFKHNLASEADRIRAELQRIAEPGLAKVADEWAERAGRKGGHEHDPDAAAGSISSPVEG